MSLPGLLALGSNRPRQFYTAGDQLAAFTGVRSEDRFRPEDWLGSTTTRFGSEADGLTVLGDGESLAKAVAEDPWFWLGSDHLDAFGADTNLLVKLLDAGQRLPVHLHPTRSFARGHLGSHHGKTEAWIVLGVQGEGEVWLGFQRDVERPELEGWVRSQDRSALLGALNRLSVQAGDAILVPAGTPHAIGPGVFCIELQEPTDFSLNLEWAGFELPSGLDGQLGLSMDTVLEAVRHGALTGPQLDGLRRRLEAGGPQGSILPAEADPFFRAERVGAGAERGLEPGFSVLVVLAGSGTISAGDTTLPVRRGSIVLSAWGGGPLRLEGDIDIVRCLPPHPSTAAGGDGKGGAA
jgi:mannose-6-phosphate isomerase